MAYQIEQLVSRTVARRAGKKLILVGDVGGTTTRLAIANVGQSRPRLLSVLLFPTAELPDLKTAVITALEYAKSEYKSKITVASLGVAGPVNPQRTYGRLINIKWDVDTKSLKKETTLKSICLFNDFEALGYAVNILSATDKLTLTNKKIKAVPRSPKLVLGPGTGLGATWLVYDHQRQQCRPQSAEFGPTSWAPQTTEQEKLAKYILTKTNSRYPLKKHLLKGRGLIMIYNFTRSQGARVSKKFAQQFSQASEVEQAKLIAASAKKEPACRQTKRLFTEVLAASLRDLALIFLPRGGVYLAGGIVQRNSWWVKDKKFIQLFQTHDEPAFRQLLTEVPLIAITNKRAGLLGAAAAWQFHHGKV